MSWNNYNFPHNNGGHPGLNRRNGGGNMRGGYPGNSYNSGFGRAGGGGGGGGGNYRGGGGNDINVNDEVVGGAGGAANFQRNMFQNFRPGMFNNPYMFPNFPGAFRGPAFSEYYGNYPPWPRHPHHSLQQDDEPGDQQQHQQHYPPRHHSESGKSKNDGREEPREGQEQPPSESPLSLSKKQKSEEDGGKEHQDGPGSAAENSSSKGSLSPMSSSSRGPQSPSSDKMTVTSRRKQSTPQKVPLGSSPTNVITKKGLSMPESSESGKSEGDKLCHAAPVDETSYNAIEIKDIPNKSTPNAGLSTKESTSANDKTDLQNRQTSELGQCVSKVNSTPSKAERKFVPEPENKTKEAGARERSFEQGTKETVAESNLSSSHKDPLNATTSSSVMSNQSVPNPSPIVMPRRSKGEMKSYSEIPAVIPSSEPKQFTSPPRRTGRNREKNNKQNLEEQVDNPPTQEKRPPEKEIDSDENNLGNEKSGNSSSGKAPKPNVENKDLLSCVEEEGQIPTNKPRNGRAARDSAEALAESSSSSENQVRKDDQHALLTPRSKRMSAHKALMSLKMKEMNEYAMENLTSPSDGEQSRDADNEQTQQKGKKSRLARVQSKKDSSTESDDVEIIGEIASPKAGKDPLETVNKKNPKENKAKTVSSSDTETVPEPVKPKSTTKSLREVRKIRDKPIAPLSEVKAKPDETATKKPLSTPTRSSSRITSPVAAKLNPIPAPPVVVNEESLPEPPENTKKPDGKTKVPSSKGQDSLPSESENADDDSFTVQGTRVSKRTKRKVVDNNLSLTSDSETEDKRGTKRRKKGDPIEVSDYSTPVRASARKRNYDAPVQLDESVAPIEITRMTFEESDIDTSMSHKSNLEKGKGSTVPVDDQEKENVNKVSKTKKDKPAAPSKKKANGGDVIQQEHLATTGNKKKKGGGKSGSDWKGPYIQIQGFFNSPRTVKVVNSDPSEEKKDNQRTKRGLYDAEHRVRSANIGHSSTLSKEYDHKNVDETWKCVFCKKSTHYKGLGDLFGPYLVKMEGGQGQQSSKNAFKPSRRKKSQTEEQESGSQEEETEVWFHEDCLVWIPGIYILGSRVVGIEESVNLCSGVICMVCGETGASLGCTIPACRNAVHVPCCMDTSWHTDIDRFKATCSACVQRST